MVWRHHSGGASSGPPWTAPADFIARVRARLHIGPEYNGELEDYADGEDSAAQRRELFREFLLVSSNDPAVTRLTWQYLPHTLEEQNDWYQWDEEQAGEREVLTAPEDDEGDCLSTLMEFWAEALQGNTCVQNIYSMTDSAFQPDLVKRFMGLREDAYDRFLAALCQSSVTRIQFPDTSWFDLEVIHSEVPEQPGDEEALALATCRRLALQRQCALNATRLIAANDPATTVFFPQFTDGRLTVDERERFLNFCDALEGNTHLTTLGNKDGFAGNGFWHAMYCDPDQERTADSYFYRLLEALPLSKVYEVDVAKFRCNCDDDGSDSDSDSDTGDDTQGTLMRACVSNLASRLAANDPTTTRAVWENANVDSQAIVTIAAGLHGNHHLRYLDFTDRVEPCEANGWRQLVKIHAQDCACGWRHDPASDAMAAFKTAIRNSGVERVEWAGYDPREHRDGIQREIDQLCHVNQRHNEWLKGNRPFQRLLLAVLCHQTAATDGGGRSLVASALSFPTDLLALVCDHLGKTRGCPGQSAWQKGDFVMRSTRSGVTFIPDLPARVDNELFAWHVPLKTGAPSAKRARTTSRR
jgi:hypothetical protein